MTARQISSPHLPSWPLKAQDPIPVAATSDYHKHDFVGSFVKLYIETLQGTTNKCCFWKLKVDFHTIAPGDGHRQYSLGPLRAPWRWNAVLPEQYLRDQVWAVERHVAFY